MTKQILDLCGKWQFKEYPASARRMRDLDADNWLDCSVPSSIYNCLTDAALIDSKDLKSNPENYLWPSEKNWIFQKYFDVSAVILESDKIELVFDGLDTFSQIWLNEKLISKTDNMFCSYRFDVKSLLKEKDNRLLIKFDSPIEEGNRLMKRFGMLSSDACSLPCRAYVRKAQCQFGWDWAPQMPGCGIWQKVRIEGFSSAKIGDIHIRTVEADSASADIRISIQIEKVSGKTAAICKLTVLDPDGNIAAKSELDLGHRDNISTVFKLEPVYLWRPASYGKQNLYTLKAELFCENELIEVSSKKFGVRTVQLNQTPDEYGTSFQFIINHQPIYVRGAAWIPKSLFISSAGESDNEALLTMVRDANINMLRVWGGGIYETEEFYNTCDRLGIMVWQDFTFACAYYPQRHWFTGMIKKEAVQNITRLRNHPSLVLWCGNNEIDWGHNAGFLGKSKKFHGKDIYHKILPQLISELDPDRDYISSTPYGRPKNPNDPSTGTVHQWNVWSQLEPTENYLKQVPRFAAEFGFQSLPEKKTLAGFVPDKIQPASFELEKHDYQPNGSSRLHYYINELFRPPVNIDEFIYLSQVTQARAIRKNVEHLRSNSKINSGVLFWQFNDCCPAISWSCVDYAHRPKVLYYYAKRVYSPIILTASAKKDSLDAFIINNSIKPITGLFICRMSDMNLTVMDEFKRPVSVSPEGQTAFSLPQSFVRPANPANCFIHLSLENDSKSISQNSFFYLPDKYINWPKAQIDIQGERKNDFEWLLKLKSLSAVKDLYVNLPFDAEFSDNCIDLLTAEPKEIIIRTKESTEDLPKKISLMSVNSIFTS